MDESKADKVTTAVYWKCELVTDPETDEEFYDIVEEGITIEGWEGKTFIRLFIPNKD